MQTAGKQHSMIVGIEECWGVNWENWEQKRWCAGQGIVLQMNGGNANSASRNIAVAYSGIKRVLIIWIWKIP